MYETVGNASVLLIRGVSRKTLKKLRILNRFIFFDATINDLAITALLFYIKES